MATIKIDTLLSINDYAAWWDEGSPCRTDNVQRIIDITHECGGTSIDIWQEGSAYANDVQDVEKFTKMCREIYPEFEGRDIEKLWQVD